MSVLSPSATILLRFVVLIYSFQFVRIQPSAECSAVPRGILSGLVFLFLPSAPVSFAGGSEGYIVRKKVFVWAFCAAWVVGASSSFIIKIDLSR